MSEKNYVNYWDLNIKKWGELYFNKNLHEEDVDANLITKIFYRKIIFPLERKVMQQRYELTIKFIDTFLDDPNLIVNDIGCGTGLFTNILLSKGYRVNSIDFSKTAIETTLKYIKENSPDKIQNLQTFKLNAVSEKLPKSDHTICMGVLPYIKKDELNQFFNNINTFEKTMLINWVNSNNFNNIIRNFLSFLNVRNLNFQNQSSLLKIYDKINCHLKSNTKSGTGFLHVLERSS